MKFTATKVTAQPEILKVHTGGEYTKPVLLADSAFTNGVCKAGAPISANGLIANGAAYVETADTEMQEGKTYYTESSGSYTKFTGSSFSPGTTYYEKSGDEATAAEGILLNDVTDDNPNGTILVAFGVVNTANAEANANITIASGVKTTLANIVFA